MKCPKCGSEDVEENYTVDYVEYNEEEGVEYVYWIHKCKRCKEWWRDENE